MSILSSKSKKTAAIISYLSLAASTVSSIILTKIILAFLGNDGYGLYQMIYSLASNVMILDLGIGTVMIRYISEYRAKEDEKGEQNFAAMMCIISCICSVVILILCAALIVFIGNIYPKLSAEEVATSRMMLVLMSIQFVLTIFSHFTSGFIQGYERFVYSSVRGLFSTFATFFLTFAFLMLDFGCVGIVSANLTVTALLLIADIFVLFKGLKVKIKLYEWDKVIIKPAVGLMVAMLLQSIVGHINSSADKTILGIMCEKSDVTIYSIAATIITMFNTIPTVLSGFFQPQVTRMITNNEKISSFDNLVAKVGRIQFMFCSAILGAFFLFGKDFLRLWVGAKIAPESWKIVLIIMPVNMIPLIQTICLSILNGLNKRLYRSIILVSITVINIILTVILINFVGPIGAPIGTAIAYLIGHVILLNIYYRKSIGLNIIKIFKDIFSKSWICFIVATALSIPVTLWKDVSIISFVVKCSAFCIIYFVLLYFFGINKDEKSILESFLIKFHIKRRNKNV